MRLLPLLLAALLIVPGMAAQSMTVTSAHQIRIGFGDLLITDDQVEDAGHWNVEQRLLLTEGANGTATIPAGHTLGTIHCSDGCDFDVLSIEPAGDGAKIKVVCNTTTDDGFCAVNVPHNIAGTNDAFAMSIPVAADTTVFVYATEGLDVRTGTADLLEQPFYYPGATLPIVIHQFTPTNGALWVAVSPQAVMVDGPGMGNSAALLAGLAGLVVGIAIWYLLVAQGIVQKRQRKQIAGVAAHKQAASKEGKTTLEWRRRALLAAMKELEMARVDQTIDLQAYDSLKSDFKRQTVTVMRALEELGE